MNIYSHQLNIIYEISKKIRENESGRKKVYEFTS